MGTIGERFDHDPTGLIVNAGVELVGDRQRTSVEVSVNQSVVDEIKHHAHAALSREVGGFLLGNCKQNDGITSVVITDRIEAEGTIETRGSITFTHATWELFHRRKQLLYPDKKVLGWYHTHPGYGVFLSKQDRFIQSNFFTESSDIAMVVDPLEENPADGWGFFCWDNGKVKRCPYFIVYWSDNKDSEHTTEPELQRIELSSEDFLPRDKDSAQKKRQHPLVRISYRASIVQNTIGAVKDGKAIVRLDTKI